MRWLEPVPVGVACGIYEQRIIEGDYPFRASYAPNIIRCMIASGLDVWEVKRDLQHLCKVWGVRFDGEWWPYMTWLARRYRYGG